MGGGLVDHVEIVVWPAAFERLDLAFPELGLRRTSKGWQASAALTYDLWGVRPDRVVSLRPGWFAIAGGGGASWVSLINGGEEPRGQRWAQCVAVIARRVGLDAPWLDGRAAPPAVSDEQRRKLERARAQREAQAKRKDAEAVARASELWEAHAGTEGHERLVRYVEHRGVRIADLPGGALPASLRFAASLPYYRVAAGAKPVRVMPDGPALLGRVVNAAGETVGVQRIYLARSGDGKREGPDEAKKAAGRLAGGACRLSEPVGDDALLILCEGIETGLALAAAAGASSLGGVGVWACISTGGLMSVELPEAMHVREVLIAADHDEVNTTTGWRPGEHYARRAAERLRTMRPRLSVCVSVPPERAAGVASNGGVQAV